MNWNPPNLPPLIEGFYEVQINNTVKLMGWKEDAWWTPIFHQNNIVGYSCSPLDRHPWRPRNPNILHPQSDFPPT